ncbi:L-erythro-3,5-diaminohexanoate dehydrogenase [Lujinxingia litoralis]|uniref:L-erythro-3,5-diaminohexanoate dehydrogenase n=1 Tax=Lujinxingia litoralis TaxID=2211119 RepID=A0A328C657_9DELT|nr:L-erythro-3,5-diaminohexanoate dehydrogenase [Lujinxingia litoralis]RAL20796.1 L-erythro-3,5-diaminohexanoate dehydrogenase [Lujinxingia litoralis]
MSERRGHDLGLHRVIEPQGALPQAAERLDAESPAFENEIVIDVQTLNIDSASFHQIMGELGRDEAKVGERVREIVAARGKMQNPVTGSGGMLLGTVKAIGKHYQGPVELKVGQRVATLVSLTLTPLKIDAIEKVHLDADQIDIRGTAYLWPSSPVVAMPEDLPERVALSALDVCGAPAQTARLVEGKERVLILGAGKSGMLCAATARATLGEAGKVYAVDLYDENLKVLQDAGIVDDFRTANAKVPTEVLEAVEAMTGGEPVDVVINTCNVSGTEMSAILPVKDRGVVYFFNMATDFSRAALGSEGVGKDVDLLIGNGYAHGHAELTLKMVREFAVVRRQLEGLAGA